MVWCINAPAAEERLGELEDKNSQREMKIKKKNMNSM